jgi:hypothetical protein
MLWFGQGGQEAIWLLLLPLLSLLLRLPSSRSVMSTMLLEDGSYSKTLFRNWQTPTKASSLTLLL